MPVPVAAMVTVWLPDTAAEAVAVAVIMVPAASVAVLVLTESCTEGKSLSVITMSSDRLVPNVMPAEGLEMVSVAVSVPSISASSKMVKVTEPVVAPSKMVMVVPDQL